MSLSKRSITVLCFLIEPFEETLSFVVNMQTNTSFLLFDLEMIRPL